MKVLLTAINSKYIHTGLGLRYVAQYARDKGETVSLCEETINTPLPAILDKIMKYRPDVCGFSVHIWNRRYVFQLAAALKILRPETVIVLGGPEVSFAVEKTFADLEAADYIVQGEGEYIFSDLLEYLREGGPVPEHVAYRDHGRINTNGGVALVEDLSALPFPYEDLDLVKEKHKIVYYECTRGCPFRCAYCLSGISRSVRKRPLHLVLRDLQRFLEAGVELVKFVDRTYNLDEDYFLPIMKYLAAADTKTVFHFEIKAEMLSAETMGFLATVPEKRFQFEIGIQSTNPATLRAINRRNDWLRLSRNITGLLSNENIHVHVDLIAGLPFEGLEEFSRSFNDVYSLQADKLQLGFLKVLPGTQLAAEREEHGLRFMEEPPYEVLATRYLPYEELRLLKKVEEVLEHTGNNPCFKHTVRALIAHSGGDAFAFYCRFAEWWSKREDFFQPHNNKSVAAILYKFIGEVFDGESGELLREILRWDVFANITDWRPEWLEWQEKNIFSETSAFWRDEVRVKHYIADYQFSSWRAIRRKYPVERFKYHWLTEERKDFYVLLDCTADKKRIHIIDI